MCLHKLLLVASKVNQRIYRTLNWRLVVTIGTFMDTAALLAALTVTDALRPKLKMHKTSPPVISLRPVDGEEIGHESHL